MSEVGVLDTQLDYFQNTISSIYDILVQIRDSLSQSLLSQGKSSGSSQFDAIGKGGFVKQFAGMFKTIGGMFGKYLAPLMLMGTFLKGIVEPFQQILEPFEVLGEIFGMVLYPILQPLMDKLWGMVDAVAAFMQKIEPFYPMIEQISALILDLIINVVYAKIMYIYNKIIIWFNFIMSIVKSITDLFKGKISFAEFFGIKL